MQKMTIKDFTKGCVGVGCFWLVLHTPLALAEPADGLIQAMQAALTLNPDVRRKQSEVSAKNYLGDSARALRYPTLSGEVNAFDDETQSSTLTASQPLWAFGNIDNRIAFADADVVLELSDFQRVKRVLMDQTASAYARVQGVIQKIDIADDNMAALSILYAQVQRREQGQLASIADVRLANARLIQASAQNIRFYGEYEVAKNELYALTQSTIYVEEQTASSITALPGLAQLLVLSMEQSADLRYKSAHLALAKADVEREKTSMMPTVNLEVQRIDTTRTGFNDDTLISVVLEGTLAGLGFRARGRNRSFGARVEAARHDLMATQNEIKRSVNTFYRNREAQQGLIQAQAQSVGELQDILVSDQRQYEAGRKAWLDVLNIQREVTEQRLQWAQAQNDWLINSLKLAVLIGQLDPLVSETGFLNEPR
jgi:adhesin transport system outer membrane protein